MKIPVLTTDRVFHIGTLEPSAKRLWSLEGHCLSVSRCPAAWRRIARLGGFPLWELSASCLTFLDVPKVATTKALRQRIERWAVAAGYATPAQLWRSWTTDEAGSWCYSMHATAEAAVAETECDEGPDGQPAVEPVQSLYGTAALVAIIGRNDVVLADIFDYLALVWAQLTQPGIDGGWWQEAFDPFGLSAPRGGIFPERVATLERRSVAFERIGDEPSPLKRGWLNLSSTTSKEL